MEKKHFSWWERERRKAHSTISFLQERRYTQSIRQQLQNKPGEEKITGHPLSLLKLLSLGDPCLKLQQQRKYIVLLGTSSCLHFSLSLSLLTSWWWCFTGNCKLFKKERERENESVYLEVLKRGRRKHSSSSNVTEKMGTNTIRNKSPLYTFTALSVNTLEEEWQQKDEWLSTLNHSLEMMIWCSPHLSPLQGKLNGIIRYDQKKGFLKREIKKYGNEMIVHFPIESSLSSNDGNQKKNQRIYKGDSFSVLCHERSQNDVRKRQRQREWENVSFEIKSGLKNILKAITNHSMLRLGMRWKSHQMRGRK